MGTLPVRTQIQASIYRIKGTQRGASATPTSCHDSNPPHICSNNSNKEEPRQLQLPMTSKDCLRAPTCLQTSRCDASIIQILPHTSNRVRSRPICRRVLNSGRTLPNSSLSRDNSYPLAKPTTRIVSSSISYSSNSSNMRLAKARSKGRSSLTRRRGSESWPMQRPFMSSIVTRLGVNSSNLTSPRTRSR